MNSLEDRLRAGLESPLSAEPADPADTMLDRVHHGARRRRRRRTTAMAAASVLAVAAVAIGVGSLTRQSAGPELPPSTNQPSLPADATVGAIDLAVPDAEHVFKLTVNEGCAACSTVWLLHPDGTWERLHDFEGREAYGGKVDPLFGPIEYVDFATNARDGWAWGRTLFSTHDGGHTWALVESGPGGPTPYGHWVHLTSDRAWSMHRTDRLGTRLWSTPIGSDDWTTVDLPDPGSATDIETVGDRVVAEASDEGLASPRLLSSVDGSDWTRLDLPCPGENQPYPGATEVFLLCPSAKGATIHRSVGLASWELFGHSDLTAVTASVPLSDDRVLLLGSPHDLLVTADGSEPVDVGLQGDEEVFQDTGGVAGDTAYLVTSKHRILVSRDSGLMWSELG